MCGRFTLKTPAEVLAEQLQLAEVPELPLRYNIAPTQAVAVVRQHQDQRLASLLRWGLVPHWSKDLAIGSRLINARAETAAEKPAFRTAFKRRRCLVLADGFYEWQKTGQRSPKQPYYFGLDDERPFAFAGLWEQWEGTDGYLETCTILTTAANELLQPIHDRMPVILHPDDYARWLDPDLHQRGPLEELLKPYPADLMQAHPVSRHVNKVSNDDPQCIAPVMA